MEEQNRVAFKRNEYGDILVPRYRLATTHTARRTGITLMYLSKMLDSHEMMSISGHKTESVFNDYIKISGIELATSIAKKWRKPNRKQRSNRYCWNSSGKCRLNSLPDFSNWQRPVLPDNRYNHRGL